MNPYQLRQELERVEEEIFEAEEKQESLEEQLGDPSLYSDGEEASSAVEEYNDIEAALGDLYDRWEQIAEFIETATDD